MEVVVQLSVNTMGACIRQGASKTNHCTAQVTDAAKISEGGAQYQEKSAERHALRNQDACKSRRARDNKFSLTSVPMPLRRRRGPKAQEQGLGFQCRLGAAVRARGPLASSHFLSCIAASHIRRRAGLQSSERGLRRTKKRVPLGG